MMTTHRDDSIDDGGLLDGDAQGLHVEVEERVEDGHWGRLEQEDQLDPDLMMISLGMMITPNVSFWKLARYLDSCYLSHWFLEYLYTWIAGYLDL